MHPKPKPVPTGRNSTRAHFLRYSLLIRRLQRGQASREQLTELILTEQADVLTSYSRNSLARDFKDIAELFGVVVTCCRRTNLYAIDEAESGGVDELRLQLLEAWEMQTAVRAAATVAAYVQLEARRPAGTEHLRPLLRAIQGRRVVQFTHQKHWEDALTHRTVWPLGLKQSAGRWYVLALDQPGSGFRTFGLDRVQDVAVLAQGFPAQAFDAAAYFHDAFGATRPDDGTAPVDLLLAFDWQQGRYVEDYPLHPSQTTVRRDQVADEIQISLRVYWTHEVLMALLAYGPDVAVLAPPAVRAAVAEAHRAAAAGA